MHNEYNPFNSNPILTLENTNIVDCLGGYTSDHTQQSITAILKDTNDVEVCRISGLTWNTLEKGRAISNDIPYSNNPLNIQESLEAYRQRKEAQIQDILQKITSGKLDFILLQESRFFSDPSLTEQIESFKNQLEKLGWGYAIPDNENKKTKDVLTLWNKNVLELQNSQGILPDSKENIYTGFETNFKTVEFDQSVTLVNLHLDYEKDYTNEILAYQLAQIESGQFTLMGGDTNHPQNYNQIGLIGNWYYASHLSEVGGFQMNIDGTYQVDLSLERVENGISYIKRYDGFFANPASSDTKVLLIEEESQYISKNNDGSLQVKTLCPCIEYPNYYIHETELGKPYIRYTPESMLNETLQANCTSEPPTKLLAENIFSDKKDFLNLYLNDDHSAFILQQVNFGIKPCIEIRMDPVTLLIEEKIQVFG